MFTDYKAFNRYTEDKCLKIKVNVPPNLYGGVSTVDQIGLICFARMPIEENQPVDYPVSQNGIILSCQ